MNLRQGQIENPSQVYENRTLEHAQSQPEAPEAHPPKHRSRQPPNTNPQRLARNRLIKSRSLAALARMLTHADTPRVTRYKRKTSSRHTATPVFITGGARVIHSPPIIFFQYLVPRMSYLYPYFCDLGNNYRKEAFGNVI